VTRKKMSHEDARAMLMNNDVLFDQDFHALSSDAIGRLEQAANATGYRKRKDAPGSKVRMYYQFLQRLPMRAGHESLSSGAPQASRGGLKIGDLVRYSGGYGSSYVITGIDGQRAKLRSLIGNHGETASLSDLWKER
jgi:hypothetical protein